MNPNPFCWGTNGGTPENFIIYMLRRRVPVLLVFSFLSLLAFDGNLSFAVDTLRHSLPLNDGAVLTSSGGTFELGFFSPGALNNRYLGVWYKNNPETVVWVANRDSPIPGLGGSLMLDESGNLVILNSRTIVVWSSNVTKASVAQLLDNGNFVLIIEDSAKGSGQKIIWQSFDHPTDTLLPGMKIGWNFKTREETYLKSWKTLDDPSSGKFTYRLQIGVLPQMVIASGSSRTYRTGPWKGVFFDGIPLINDHPIFSLLVETNSDEIYHAYEPSNSSIITRMALNESGSVQRYIKYSKNGKWEGLFKTPLDICDNYAQCGINGLCIAGNPAPCKCLKGFVSNSSPGNLDAATWTSATKCLRSTSLNCQQGEGFIKMEKIKLPDMIQVTWNQSMDPQRCEFECLKNCSCVAYANLNISGSGTGCMMWFGDLVDVKQQTLGTQNLYLRVPASELASVDGSNKKTKVWIILAVLIPCGFMFCLALCFIWIRKQRKGRQSNLEDTEVPIFDLSLIDRATNSFAEANILGEGGFGVVYKGKLSTGQDIAVKRLSKDSGQGIAEFRNEVTLIAKLQHRNLVSLLGICVRGEDRMLIYEYMPNKSLDYLLFDNKTNIILWEERFNILMGVARGLLYLHQDSKLHVVHRDLKAANILLDSNMNPKISDFGLARIFNDEANQARTKRVVGTYGYMSPEYAVDGRFSVKSDVFSFGVLILEAVSSRRNRGFYHSDHHHSLLGHAWLLWLEGRALDLVDASLMATATASQVIRCIHVGLLCVQGLAADRPDMSAVVFMLANEGINLPQPKQPGFFVERDCSTTTSSSKEIETLNSVYNCTLTMPQSR